MKSRIFLTSVLGLGLLVGLVGCATSSVGMPSTGSHPVGPGSSIMVADVKCGDVVASVRRKMRKDPALSGAQEMELIDGARFVLPWRRDGQRRWQATVTVSCFGKDHLTSRVTVEVRAQRQKPNGSWGDVSGDTGDLAEQVLEAIYPLP